MPGIDDIAPVLDLKPLEYNPFLDGSVVFDEAGGVLVPYSGSPSPPPLANTLLDSRPGPASTQSLIDSAQQVSKGTVTPNPAALRGYATNSSFFDTRSFEQSLDALDDAQLNNFIDGLTSKNSRAAAQDALLGNRKALTGALKLGSELATPLSLAVDGINIGAAIADPTNNPSDEIGDFVGSTIGGALGAGLGPLGAFGGALVGGWLGRQIGNLVQGSGSRGIGLTEGEPNFTGGQCPNVAYGAYISWREGSTNRATSRNIGNGPIDSGLTTTIRFEPTDFGNGNVIDYWNLYLINPNTGFEERIRGSSSRLSNDVLDVRPIFPWQANLDVCGNPPAPLVEAPTRPDYAPVKTRGPNNGGPQFDDVNNPGLENPFRGPDLFPDFPDVSGPTIPDLDNPDLDPTNPPGDLPETQPDGGGGQPEKPPEPEQKCCPQTIGRLDEVIRLLTQAYAGVVDLTPCDGNSTLVEWQGTGLGGVVEAIKAAQFQAQVIHNNTKCGPDPAPLPMLWEVRSGQVPQLAIVWARVSGGSSRWSMHVPHPRADISPDTPLAFPDYVKGSLMATLKLKDNSKVIVNARDRVEADKVMGYLTTNIIDGAYLTDSKLTYTEGAASRVVAHVKAVHITAFSDTKEAPPLWAKSLD